MALELEHIQGFVLFGYGHLEYSTYLLLHLDDGERGRAWLAGLAPQITAARAEKGDSAINIALTFAGLKALDLPENGLGTFPRQFQEGMAAPDRARILGDEGRNTPENWQFGGPNTEDVHLLLLLFAHTAEGRETLAAQQEAACAAGGLRVLQREDSVRPRSNQEHFGFRDGLSQPAIDGSPAPPKPGETVLPAGEFLLGYPNAYGQLPFAPTIAASGAGLGLTPDPDDPTRLSLGRNSTYLVFRKLQQHVGPFWDYYQAQAAASGASDREAEALQLAAKSVGRWRSGAPLALSPDRDSGQSRNNFVYRKLDPDGLRCPFGAHVRRANPRDMLPPGISDESVTINHHRILRRGRPYGPCLSDPETDRDDGIERGLLFLALNANIRRQFEFVQQTWIGNPNFGGLYTDRDALLGSDPEATVTIPGLPVRTRLCGLPQFVTMRGGSYFFVPSLPTLRFLADFQGG
jgi:Dyp-type peroxidase family